MSAPAPNTIDEPSSRKAELVPHDESESTRSSPASSFRENAADAALLGLCLLVFGYAWLYYPISQGHTGDFLAMLSHRQAAGYWDGKGLGYGPVFALYDLALRPLTDAPAMRVMFVVNHVICGATFVLLAQVFLPPKPSRRVVLLALLAWLNFYPLVQLIRQNNVELTELFFVALYFHSLRRGHRLRAGAALGMAISTKLLPIFLLPYLVWRRRGVAAAVAVATAVAMIAIVLLIKSIPVSDALSDWHSATTIRWMNEWNNNQALSGFFWRLFSHFDFSTIDKLAYPTPYNPAAAGIATRVASAALVLVVVGTLVRRGGLLPRSAPSLDIELAEFGALFSVLLLILPHSHTHYFGLMVWVYIGALGMWRKFPAGRPQKWFVASYALLGCLLPLRLFDPLAHRWTPASFLELWKLFSLPMAGALLAVVALLGVHGQLLRGLSKGARN